MITIAGLAVLLGACGGKKENTDGNPFFSEYKTPFGVPPFEEIRPEHYKPAFLKGMEEQKKEIEAIIADTAPATFENTIAALDQSGSLLRRVRTVFSGLNSANGSDEIQALDKELSPLLSQHSDDNILNPALFARVKAVYEGPEKATLNKEQAKLTEETYKNFIRGGANLDAEQQEKLRELNGRLSLLQITFGQNMLKETNAFKLVIDNEQDLAGLPESLIAGAKETAGEEGKWVFTLHNPSIMPFLQFADNRALREQLFNAYLNRGNNGGENDNKAVVKELITLRLEKAKLLGYTDYAAFILEERMAQNAANVYSLLQQVWEPALVKAKSEAADLQALMHKEGTQGELQGWDWSYYTEKVKKARFDLDENQLRPYLKLENVRNGMFWVAHKLYGITFTTIAEIPKPHPEAEAFECKDRDGTHLGVLYLDYFPRSTKRGGAWCGTYRPQAYANGERIAPVVTIVCNFTKPSGGQPALFSADEAETLFHEFGHALHNLFKDVHYYGVAGVPRDFVELPSQIMEHWVFQPEVLNEYARHYQTGEAIPGDLVDKLEKSGTYGEGFATSEYIEASVLDMDFHVLKEIPADFGVIAFEAASMKRLHTLPQIPPRYRSTYFNHTMGGGYTAGYYSYMWAEVLDADAFQAFVEAGNLFDPATAERFRKYILTPGGIDDATTMYINFRGAEPGVGPLLKNRGLK